MPYVKRTVIAGDTIEVTKYFSSRYGGKKSPRSLNEKETSEKQKKVNENHAEAALRQLFNTNFHPNDFSLSLTYPNDSRPSPEEAKENLKHFKREMRKLYKKNGAELKYICTTEYERKNLHHHMVCNSGAVNLKEIQEIWEECCGRNILCSFLYQDKNYKKLAEYYIKETNKTFSNEDAPNKKRWESSRNLKKPEIKRTIVDSNYWRENPLPIKGYYIEPDSVFNSVDEYFGRPYQHYIMRRCDKPKK